MKHIAKIKGPGGVTISVHLDIDSDGTHKTVREAVESVMESAADAMKRRAIAKAPNAVFKVGALEYRLKDHIKTFRTKSKGKNITNKTDKFGIVAGGGDYPAVGKQHPKAHLAKPAHIELGTVKSAPRPFMYPAYDETKAELLSELEGVI